MERFGWSWQIKNSCVLLIVFALLSAREISVVSSLKAIASQKKKPSVVIFQPPPEDAEPEETAGAASRNGNKCPEYVSTKAVAERSKFRALVPQTNSGLTTQEYPTFWVYIPPTTARSAILSIAKIGEKPYWHQSIDLTGKPGEIGVKLDEAAKGLEIGQNYRWALILVCGTHPHPNDPLITAGVKRIGNNLSPDLTSLEQASWYAERGIWYDALDILAREKSSQSDGGKLWSQYLRSGGFVNRQRSN